MRKTMKGKLNTIWSLATSTGIWASNALSNKTSLLAIMEEPLTLPSSAVERQKL